MCTHARVTTRLGRSCAAAAGFLPETTLRMLKPASEAGDADADADAPDRDGRAAEARAVGAPAPPPRLPPPAAGSFEPIFVFRKPLALPPLDAAASRRAPAPGAVSPEAKRCRRDVPACRASGDDAAASMSSVGVALVAPSPLQSAAELDAALADF